MKHLENRVPPLLLVVVCAIAMAVCAGLIPGLSVHYPVQRIAAALLASAGFAVMAAAVIQFRRARTTVDPVRPEAASALVSTGIFNLSRNPMYLGMAMVLAGWAVFLGNAVAPLFVWGFVAWINRFQIAPEERALKAHFGQAFDAYTDRVRRWI